MEQEPKIPKETEKRMKGVAIIFEIVGAIANAAGGVGGSIVNGLGYVVFALWFKSHGLGLFAGRHATTTWWTLLLELFPGLNILPGISIMVWQVIKHQKEEAYEEEGGRVVRERRQQPQTQRNKGQGSPGTTRFQRTKGRV